MDARDHVNGLLIEVGSRVGQILRLSDDGRCVLMLDTGLLCEVQVPEASDQLLLSARLDEADASTSAELAAFALSLNHNLHATRGCTIAIAQDRRLYLQLARGVSELNAPEFSRLLGGFITTTKQLSERIGHFIREGEESLETRILAEELPLWQQVRG